MWWCKVLFACVALVSLECAAQSHSEDFKEEYIWASLDFAWPDDSSKAEALKKGHFERENNVLSGIKVWQGRIYLTIPRWKPGVPATLVSIPASNTIKRSLNLEPFPNWDMQVVGDCNALQSVQNIEIDTNGQMWILDSGRTNILTSNPDNKCPPKLMNFDLQTSRMKKIFKFSETVVSKENDSLLVDLVLDSDNMVYISDASKSDPGIIVFDTNNEQAWKVRDSSMKVETMLNAVAADQTISFPSNVNALALTPKAAGAGNNEGRTLYYSPLNSFNLFAISTSVLRDQHSATANNIHTSVTDLGNKTSLSQAMIIDSSNIMYMGLNSNHSIARWNTKKLPLIDNLHVFSTDPVRMQWPSSFSLDTEGNLWVISNKFQKFLTGTVDLQDTNYRIMRATTNTSSYLYPEEEEKTTSIPVTTRMPEATTRTINMHNMDEHAHGHDHDHDHDHGHVHNHDNHTHTDGHSKPNVNGTHNAADSVARPATTILAILASVMTFILTLE